MIATERDEVAKDPRIFTDVAELLEDYEDELSEALTRTKMDDREVSEEDVSLRLQRVSDVRARYLREFD